MPGKKKGGKKISKAEQEKLEHERKERLHNEQLAFREKDSELKQDHENERRDAEELEERRRARKEELGRLMALKDIRILTLSNELEQQKMLFAAERGELETELGRMIQLRESLLNELSKQKAESDETEKRLLDECQRLYEHEEKLKEEHLKEKNAFENFKKEITNDYQQLNNKHDALTKEHKKITTEKNNNERDMIMKIKALEREVEKVSSLNISLQEIIEQREADDRKNVTLMQLLNNQLDETKQRTQEIVDEERAVSDKLKAQAVSNEAEIQTLKEQNDMLRREKESIQRQTEIDLQDYQSKIDQLKFDLKYLHCELHSFKNQCQKQESEVVQIKAAAEAETSTSKLEQEVLSKRVEELENFLRRKDREYFDKATFLNAQIANNRTIIAQLQQKLKSEREEREQEKFTAKAEIDDRETAIKAMSDEIEKKKIMAGDAQMKLCSDNSILKATVYQLQEALVEREKELNAIVTAKDQELKRLRRTLDENFIPHRKGAVEPADIKPVAQADEVNLSEVVVRLNRQLEIRTKSAQEVEARLKGELVNQGLLIDSLEGEVSRLKNDNEEQLQLLSSENEHLRKTLENHCIAYNA